MSARLLSWNVAGRVRRLDEQAAVVTATTPDLVCLQEVTPSSGAEWSRLLRAAGLGHVVLADARPGAAAGRPRPLQVLLAGRWELHPVAVADVPWPERVLAAHVAGLEVVGVHSPISPKPDLAKVRTHEAVHRHLACGRGPRLVCGDLNTPRREHPDGRVWTFARTRYGQLRPERGERWDRAELALIKGLEPHGFRDGFRELHGMAARELSWEWPQWGGGYRLDHLIASHEVDVQAITYFHEWRQAGLSDHSALLATLSWS